jgi:exodeoxyribonuclease VII small subunit
MAKDVDVESMGFEAALRRLEQTVAELESGELGLDGALASYAQGVRILKRCYSLLDGAERTVALLTGVDAEGRPVTAPFDATATAERQAPASPEARSDAQARPNRTKPNSTEATADDDSPPF